MIADWTYSFVRNLRRIFWKTNLFWHILAIASTYVLVTSGFDWRYFELTRSGTLLLIAIPAALLGFLVPLVVPLGLYLYGIRKKIHWARITGAALGQASILGWLVSSFYKIFTGRLQPELLSQIVNADISQSFNFGFFKHGIFWGWPSSHTTVAFAFAAALIMLYPRQKALVTLIALYALYIGLGVSVTIHWFSDFTAGAIIGTLIGVVVGKKYRERFK